MQCDQGRPHCKRCINSGIKCEGYQTGSRVTVYRPPRAHQPPTTASEREENDPCLPPSLRTSALRSAQFDAAWRTLQPSDGLPRNVRRSHLWLLDLPSIHVQGTALNSAYGAVALARLGQEERDASLLSQSHVAYAEALRLFMARLRKPSAVFETDEALACIMCLALFEVNTARHVYPL